VTWLTNNKVAESSVALAHLILAVILEYIYTNTNYSIAVKIIYN